ncbi:LacI family DNA-binding transcriptional regulator [Roseovarius sp. Pro17]|uniref:LacI family DNA-binding transcriptional regulator n=1 Tax=Roseovarius sp. Pro17 TaxID=3108175 RepID=UPI002D7A2816|nr:substrate-binding domain-containing protein [Roseovarius sp. Pro17]
MNEKATITIKDVARAAGCGVATASRVLNASGPASAEMSERVRRAAADLGFSFSAIGRALQSRRSMTVGCLVPSLANPVFGEAMQGVQNQLRAAGYQPLICASNYDEATDEDMLRTLLAQKVDGLIATMAAPARSAALRVARATGVPVSLMFHDPVEGFASAYVDNAAAAREVARQFIARGHRRLGFLALRFASSDRSQSRYAGFRAECHAHGLAEPALIEMDEREARNPDRIAEILRANPNITGLFASNDFLAIAVQNAAGRIGLRVPDDLSVIGFDGIDIGRLLNLPLATIETDAGAMGCQAAHSLLIAMQGGGMHQAPPLPFVFRAGATLAAAPEKKDGGRAAPRPSPVTLASVPPKTRMNP